ncbi:MAG: carbon-nitrogen hydrolase family protein [SAR202 cluster bacterium]|nr:carbon-nitrogen hydrolase family protein [SAR202 cluster bacterium]
MYRSVKAAAISLKPVKWDKAGNADRMEEFFSRAAREKPDLIVTTEGVLEGYVVTPIIEDVSLAQRMYDVAEPVDGPYIRRFRKLAKSLKTCLCFGFAELDGKDVFNTAVFIAPSGDICGTYRKVQLAEGTHPTWFFNRVGKTLRAFDTPVGRIGIVICNDRWNPMIVRTLVMDGAQMVLIPSYGSRSHKQNETVLARARENGVPIVNANVGMNLIISKGEIVAYKWGVDQITTGVIEVPEWPSASRAREMEAEYFRLQGPEMEKRYENKMKKLRGEKSAYDEAAMGALLSTLK